MKIRKNLFTCLLLFIWHTTAAQDSQGINLTDIKWLHGNWKGVGYERLRVSEPSRNKSPEVRQTEFTLSFDHSSRILKLSGKYQKIVRMIDANDEYQHYDRTRRRLDLYDIEPEDKSFTTKLSIEMVSDGQIIFSFTYNRRMGSDSFIASGALMLSK